MAVQLGQDYSAYTLLSYILAQAIFSANNTPKDSGFSPSQIVLGYAPKPPCFLQIDTSDEHVKERPRHDSTPHNAREALLAIHKTCVKYRPPGYKRMAMVR